MNSNTWHCAIKCDDGEILTAGECAKKYGVKSSTISYGIKGGRVKGHKIKLLYRYRKENTYIVYDRDTHEEVFKGTAREVADQFCVDVNTIYQNFLGRYDTFCGDYYIVRTERRVIKK